MEKQLKHSKKLLREKHIDKSFIIARASGNRLPRNSKNTNRLSKDHLFIFRQVQFTDFSIVLIFHCIVNILVIYYLLFSSLLFLISFQMSYPRSEYFRSQRVVSKCTQHEVAAVEGGPAPKETLGGRTSLSVTGRAPPYYTSKWSTCPE